MHKFFCSMAILLLFFGCSSDVKKSSVKQSSENKDLETFKKDLLKAYKNSSLKSDDYECVVNKLYFYCKALASIYERGGLYKGKEVKKDLKKAKKYNKILCEEHKKEYYCEKLERLEKLK